MRWLAGGQRVGRNNNSMAEAEVSSAENKTRKDEELNGIIGNSGIAQNLPQVSEDIEEGVPVPVVVKLEKISKNCKRFNRLFHDGEDSSSLESLDETKAINIPGFSGSKDVKIESFPISENGSTLNFNSQQFPKNKGGHDFVLEIEIEREEHETLELQRNEGIGCSVLKSEENFLKEEVIKVERPGCSTPIPIPNQTKDTYSIWNPEFFDNISDLESDEDASLSDNQDIKEEVVDDQEEEEGEEDQDEKSKTKKPKVKVKKERSDFSLGERRSSRLGLKINFCNKKHEAQVMKRVKVILKKDLEDLTMDEHQILENFPALVGVVKKRLETRLLASERTKEFEDSQEILEEKCNQLADVIRKAKYLVVYTGAGISTSAQIPDYRGPNGIWTLLKSGQTLDSQNPVVLTTADPTVTHMAIKQLYQRNVAKHIVSQNCDGLHIRSGVAKNALSEVHGNMYIEVCKCGREYLRLFDVTENTRRHEHRTGRNCYHCGHQLRDTVVHFGERGSLRWPLNWAGAEYNVNNADVILCLGSSLKVLRRYPWLWGMDKPISKRPKLFIVNLQWTPKDQYASLKIHGKCDDVMSRVMEKLNIPIPEYNRETDPIFALATPLHPSELQSKSSRELTFPDGVPFPEKQNDINNYIRFEPVFRTSLPDDLDESKSKSGNKREILKGNGNGWLGNAWGVKPKKRKLK